MAQPERSKRLAERFGERMRAQRVGPLLKLIEQAQREFGSVRIIDVGGTRKYWNIVPAEALDAHDVHITIVNLPGVELSQDEGRFTFAHGNACDLKEFGDGSFHIAHSNSVIEHVGDWEQMIDFSSTIKRVAKSYFVQTPNFWFPIEPHCMTPLFHWLPMPARVFLVSKFALGHWSRASNVDEAIRTVNSARLLTRDMMRWLFSEAEILTERLALLPKSFIAVKY